ncbi:MAG: hypothetical protein ACOVSI_10730 [Gemmatimonas sp.]
MTPASLTANALRLQADSKRVVIGSSVTWGLLNDDEQIGTDGTGESVTVRERLVFVASGSLTGGVNHTVRSRPMPRENGDLWAIVVARVET